MVALFAIPFFVFIAVVALVAWFSGQQAEPQGVASQQYFYGRKQAVMTDRELKFFRRLERVSQGKYYVFPQMHLSAMMFNKTSGRYRRLAFQRINRSSVDFALCDRNTLAPVYVVELDDRTHDTELRRKRDAGVEAMLESVNIPLVRFRDAESMTDEQIIDAFRNAAKQV